MESFLFFTKFTSKWMSICMLSPIENKWKKNVNQQSSRFKLINKFQPIHMSIDMN